jgi:lipid-A-disaccharide synthase
MSDEWRQLLYPLGFISSVAFTSRFLIQWVNSERARKSVVNNLFWQISLFGNVSLLIHAFIQLQYHICLIQVCNATISWRNLDLMRSESTRWRFSSVVGFLIFGCLLMTGAFALQFWFLPESSQHWFRIPASFWNDGPSNQVSMLWHSIGILGLLLFNCRFWVQWWSAEREGRSYLGPAFWWTSLLGALLCGAYFIEIQDLVNIVGPLFGVVPAIRNLMIIRESKESSS